MCGGIARDVFAVSKMGEQRYTTEYDRTQARFSFPIRLRLGTEVRLNLNA